jgi:uncharacterized RDD family membrane protein YckC
LLYPLTMYPTAKPSRRLAQFFLDIFLSIITLGIGWAIWSLFTYSNGQTPAMQILKLRVYDATTGKVVRWRHMFLRVWLLPIAIGLGLEILAAILAGILGIKGFSLTSHGPNPVTINYPGSTITSAVLDVIWFFVDGLWIFKGKKNRRLVDVIVKTDVVDERHLLSDVGLA